MGYHLFYTTFDNFKSTYIYVYTKFVAACQSLSDRNIGPLPSTETADNAAREISGCIFFHYDLLW